MKSAVILIVIATVSLCFFQNCSEFSPGNSTTPVVRLESEPGTEQDSRVARKMDIDANTSTVVQLDSKYSSEDYILKIDTQPENGEASIDSSLESSKVLSLVVSPNRTYLGEDVLKYSIIEKETELIVEEGSLNINIIFNGDKLFEIGPWIANKTCFAEGGGISTSWTFFGGKFLWTTNVFDQACNGVVATHQGSGNYGLGASFVNEQGVMARNIDLTEIRHVIFVRSTIAATSFNASNACGFSDWSAVGNGSLKVVTGRDCSALNINASPTGYQSIAYELKGGDRVLYGAALMVGADGSSEANRPLGHLMGVPMVMNSKLIEILYFPVGNYNFEGSSYRTDGVENYCRYLNYNPAYGNMFAFEFSTMSNRFENIGVCN